MVGAFLYSKTCYFVKESVDHNYTRIGSEKYDREIGLINL